VNGGSAGDGIRKVCFVARGDFETVPGGDTVQWRMYERVVREAGLRPITWFDDSPIPPADVYHAFNIDRPLELYPKLAEVKRRGRPFILSTIHHPNEWLTKYYASQPAGALGSLLHRSALGRSMSARETIREIVTLARDRRIARVSALLPSWRQRVRWLLANADRIMLLTDSEVAYVQTDFACEISPQQQVIVPNWSEGLGDASDEKPDAFAGLPEPPVLVVGRIEPRKGSLHISQLVERARRHVVFVGRPLNGDSAFARAFDAAVQQSRYSTWIAAGVPRSTLATFYRHSSFLLNASFVEVSPLVDIEALALGCPVSTTMYALHHQLLPPDTPLCDPYDDSSILDRLQWRPGRLPPTQVVDRELCARRLVDTYLALANAGAPRVHQR
jgi:glycosyltransferase involved in cell wall biosynthesis